MAVGVLTAGSVGIMAMIQASTRGNMEAREMTTGAMLTQRWVERLRRDGLNWTRSSTLNVADPTLLSNTQYLSLVPNVGVAPSWIVPAPAAASGESAAFDYYAQDTTTATDMHFCTNIRLEWLYVNQAMRADVRVWWLRREGGVQDPTRVALGQCAPGVDPNTLTNDWRVRMTYASTVIRYTTMPAPGP